MPDKLESRIAEATSHEDIQALLHAEPQEPAERTAKPAKSEPVEYTRTETIGGREFTFEAETADELDQMILNAYRVATAVTETAPEQPKQPSAEEEAKAAAKAAMDRSDLEIQFRRGQLSAAAYLEKTGAINDYLASQGVPVEELRQTVEQQRNNAEAQSWSNAVSAFLSSPAGADWPGGEKNKELIGLKIAQLGLVDATDKVAALAQAYYSMRESGLVFDGEATGESNRAAQSEGTSQYSAVRQAPAMTPPTQRTPQRTQVAQSSSLWGTSSGTSVNDIRDRSRHSIPVSKVVPSDARPEEILAAWKDNLIANGQDPNNAFLETFRGGRK